MATRLLEGGKEVGGADIEGIGYRCVGSAFSSLFLGCGRHGIGGWWEQGGDVTCFAVGRDASEEALDEVIAVNSFPIHFEADLANLSAAVTVVAAEMDCKG